jgi:hypothetical protein
VEGAVVRMLHVMCMQGIECGCDAPAVWNACALPLVRGISVFTKARVIPETVQKCHPHLVHDAYAERAHGDHTFPLTKAVARVWWPRPVRVDCHIQTVAGQLCNLQIGACMQQPKLQLACRLRSCIILCCIVIVQQELLYIVTLWAGFCQTSPIQHSPNVLVEDCDHPTIMILIIIL